MKANDYIELRAHSAYSLLRGTSPPETLVAAAANLGMKSLALTDHNNVYGAVSFQKAAGALDIQPILGAELTIESELAEGEAPLSIAMGRGLGGGVRKPLAEGLAQQPSTISGGNLLSSPLLPCGRRGRGMGGKVTGVGLRPHPPRGR